jgi:uncharacterized repeat protein (TIGR02543 family)
MLDGNAVRIVKLPYGTTSWVDLTSDTAKMKAVLGIAVDPQGTVYAIENVLRTSENTAVVTPKIWSLPKDGTTWNDISGVSPAFTNPFDIAADGEGNVFVSDFPGNNNIMNGTKIFKRGAYESTWTNVVPAGTMPFVSFGIDVDPFDNVVASDLFSNTVKKLGYGKGSNGWTAIEVTTPPNGTLFDVATDGNGYVYATIYSNRANVSRLMAAIVYNGNGGTGGTVPLDTTGYAPNASATVSGNTGNLSKAGHTFGGWATAATQPWTVYSPGDTIHPTQTTTLYAVWTPIVSYTITYQAGTGGTISGSGSETVVSGSHPAAVPTVTPADGYTFLGWSSDGGATLLSSSQLSSVVVSGNVTYTAYFQAPNVIALESLKLDSAGYSLSIGATHQTVVTAVYSDDSEQPLTSGVTFSSSNPSAATVNESTGLVTAVGGGSTVIKAVYGGKEAQANVDVTAPSNGTSPSEDSSTPAKPDPVVDIFVDGVKQEQLATAKRDTVNGRIVTTVTLDNQKVTDKLERENNKLLTIPVSGNSNVVVGTLTGSLVKAMETKDAHIQIVTDRATYTLPASQIKIDSISAQVGSDAKPEDITIQIQISESSEEKANQVQAAAEREGFASVVQPVDFEITATYGSQSVQANKFNSYVERRIALPEGIDPSNITTGVVLTEDGELYHVPTVVIREDGKAYAVVNSLTNSTYTVIYNPSEMSDVADHWANAEVNDMTSRLILEGVSAAEFQPDADITRAEFAAIVTRGLGIQGAPYADAFADVNAGDWYAGAVQAAVEYDLLNGYEDGAFRPDARITRQEAAVVLSRAAAIAKLASTLTDAEIDGALSAFADGGDVASWAQANVSAAIDLGLMNGRGDKLDVASNLTRAETAVLVRRLLQAASLINS